MMLGRGFLKFTQSVEFETLPNDAITDTGRRRVILLAIAPHQPESSDFFHFVCRLLDLPVDKAFHCYEADYKALALATGSFTLMYSVLCACD